MRSGVNETVRLHARLSALVARDAARRHGVALLVIVLVAGWLERAWPVAEVRAAAWHASAEMRAFVLAAVHLAWSIVTHGAAAQLVLSRRLELFRSLPRSAWWWRRFHAAHLVALDALVAGVTAYGVWPMRAIDALGWVACMVAFTFAARTFAILATPPTRALVCLAQLGVLTVVLAYVPVGGALAFAVAIAFAALLRLGRPLPEAGASGPALRLGRIGLAGLHLRALVRLRPLVVVAIICATSAIAMLVDLGWQNIARAEPDAARSLVRGGVWCIAVLASLALPISRSLVAPDLSRMDAWPISTHAAASATVRVAAALAVVPCVVLSLGDVPWIESMPVFACAIAACASSCARTHADNVAQRGDARRFGIRWALTCVIGVLVAVLAWPLLAAWALAETLVLPSSIARADRARRRFELSREDHDHG